MVNYKNCIFLALALVLSLIAIWTVMDIGMSIFGKVPPAVSLETEYIEGRGWALRRGRQSLAASINSDGLRRNGKLPPLVTKEKRILFLGESVCFSPHTVQGQDWPSIVEQRLRTSGVFVTTMNGGVPGYSMHNVRFAYPWFKDRLPIDLVVVYEGWNDLYYEKFDPDFEFDKSVKKIFPNWPSSLEPAIDYLKYDSPPSLHQGILPIVKPLRFLIDSSPAAAYIYSNLAPKFSRQFMKSEYSWPFSSAETYMFYLARLINETKKDGIPIAILRPFSVFRDKNFTHPALEKRLSKLIEILNRKEEVIKPGEENKVLVILRKWIKQIDTITDKLAENTHALVIDPSLEMFEKINPENATKGEYYSYMASPYHTGAKGDNLLGSIVAKELLKNSLVEQISQDPWVHPMEDKKENYDLQYRNISLKQFEFNRVLLVFLFAITFSLVGGMFLVLASDFEQFKNYFGWSFSLGVVTMLVSLSFLHQLINNPAWCLIISLIFLVLIQAGIILKKRFILRDNVKIFLLKVVLSSLVGSALIFCASEIAIYVLKNSLTAIKIIQEYLAWIDFQVLHPLFEKGYLTYDMLYQKTMGNFVNKGDSIERPLDLLYPLSLQERFYASGSPLLASAVSMVLGADPLDVFVTLFGLTAAVLTAPYVFLSLKKIPLILKEFPSQFLKTFFLSLLPFFLCGASFFLGMFVLVPATQISAIGISGMVFAIYFESDIYKRSLIFLLSAGLAMLTPDPLIIILIFGIILVWGMTNGIKYNNSTEFKKVAPWVSIGLLLVIFGKSMMLTYPSAHPAVFEFLEIKNLVLPFKINAQKFIALTYYLFAFLTIIFLGYFLGKNHSLGFTTLMMFIMALTFFCHQELFKSIPLVASLNIILAIYFRNNRKEWEKIS